MSFLTTAALGANLVSGIYGSQMESAGYSAVGEIGAASARYQGAVNANEILTNAENSARSSEAQAEADRFNAKLTDQLALSATVVAGAEAHDFRRTQGAKLASARAGGAASGLALEGSRMLVDENTFAQVEFGVSRIVYGGQLESARYRNQGKLLTSEAERLDESARIARESGRKSAEYAVGAGELGAMGALAGAAAKSAAARSTGWSNSLSTLAKFGTTLSTRNVNWGV